ncbi:MAG: CoA-binding protein [Rhodospirillales bacterium]|nr:CoA-binding protein [Rhodospirillales bacterium]
MNGRAASPPRYADAHLRAILGRVRTIAMVGASPNWVRPSNFVMKYLIGKGYRVIPVNPAAAGREILGQHVYASLGDVPGPLDMVDIFRASDAAGAIVDEAIAVAPEKGITVVWMQLGVRDDAAAGRAEAAGLTAVMDRCPKIEYGRLFGELSWCGVNTGIVSAKRPAMQP